PSSPCSAGPRAEGPPPPPCRGTRGRGSPHASPFPRTYLSRPSPSSAFATLPKPRSSDSARRFSRHDRGWRSRVRVPARLRRYLGYRPSWRPPRRRSHIPFWKHGRRRARGSSRIYHAHEVGTIHGARPAGRPGPHASEEGPPRGEGGRRGRGGLARGRDAADQVRRDGGRARVEEILPWEDDRRRPEDDGYRRLRDGDRGEGR